MVVRNLVACFSIRKSLGLNNRVDGRSFIMNKKDKNLNLNSEDQIDQIITSGDKLLRKALEKYIEYLEKKNEITDTDEISQKTYERIQKLRGESQELYETCKHYFQRTAEEYENTKQLKLSSNKLSCSWGNYAYAQAIVNKREVSYKDAENSFEKAREKYEEIGEGEEDDVVLRRLGNTYYELAAINMDNSSYKEAEKNFEKAGKKYEKIDKLNKDDYRNWGNALFELGRMKWREFLILTESGDVSYKKLIKKESNKIFKKQKDNDTLPIEKIEEMLNETDTLFKEVDKFYKKAIDKYTEAIDKYEVMEDKKYEDVFRSLGDIYSHRGRKNRYDYLSLMEKKEALCKVKNNRNIIKETEKKIGKAIEEIISNFESALKQYDKAEEIDIDNNGKKERDILRGATHYRLFLTYYTQENKSTKKADDELEKAKEIFKSLKSSVLDIFVDLSMDAAYPMMNDEILFPLLDDQENKDTVFFKNIVKSKYETNEYNEKRIYIHSMYIISLLEVKNEYENVIAHYTKKSISQRMLFDDEKFWLYAVNYFNDPTCGKVLLGYLSLNDETKKELSKEDISKYVTFAGSFSFDYDSLNQFRLYGKEAEREGTGVSLVFNKTFFSEEFKQDRAAFLKEFGLEHLMFIEESEKKNFEQLLDRPLGKQRKNTLFRCVYFDPLTDSVETVGQKEKYLFYREEKNKAKKIIEEKKVEDNKIKEEIYRERKKIADENYYEYNKIIHNIINDVNSELEELKTIVNEVLDQIEKKEEKEKKKSVISQLIFGLRYLVKHVAYKAEQECRIVKICRLDNNKEISISSHDKTLVSDLKMHFEYDLKVSQHVKEIYFGPKATEFEMFKTCLKHKNLHDILCKESTNPLV